MNKTIRTCEPLGSIVTRIDGRFRITEIQNQSFLR